MKKLFEIVKVFDVERILLPLMNGDCDELNYRLEVMREVGSDKFSGKVYRIEFYRVQPTFPQKDGAPEHVCDERFFVEDAFYSPELLQGNSELEVVEKFQEELKKYLEHSLGYLSCQE